MREGVSTLSLAKRLNSSPSGCDILPEAPRPAVVAHPASPHIPLPALLHLLHAAGFDPPHARHGDALRVFGAHFVDYVFCGSHQRMLSTMGDTTLQFMCNVNHMYSILER